MKKNLNSSNIASMDIIKKIGRYTMVPHYIIDCLMYSLEDSPKTCWKLVFYLLRNISGSALRNGKPKTFIKYSQKDLRAKANIKGVQGFYNAIKTLKEKEIIFFNDDKLYLNFFPLTWNLNIPEREAIKEIVEEEIKKITKKMA